MELLPSVIDVYSGVGGLSLGAVRAGFEVSAAVEIDPQAVEAHSINFPQTRHIVQDAASLSGKELLRSANISNGGLDGLIGGPPCQGFSMIGKRRVDDNRNNLFKHFFRLVRETRPIFFLAENVPGILDEKYEKIRFDAFNLVKFDYIFLPPIRVKASDYGAPTSRTRIFFIGYDPKRFKRNLAVQDFGPEEGTEKTFVGQALSGLPVEIDPYIDDEEKSWRQIERKIDSKSPFGRMINDVPIGMGDPEAIDRYFERDEVSGIVGTCHKPEVEERFGILGYGEMDKISRASRLDPNNFCPTLRAGTGKDRGSFQSVRPIHYSAPRVIAPREAARLQGFPDWFLFHPTKWHSFRQIGNSVSPIVSENLLLKIYSILYS